MFCTTILYYIYLYYNCVVVLQNCICFVEGETGSNSETCVMCDVDGTEEVRVNVEESIDIKSEIPEAITFPSIKTEQEVSLRGVCDVGAARVFRPFVAPPPPQKKKKI